MKKEIRARLLNKRDSIPLDQKLQKEDAIAKGLFALDYFQKADGILMYASFRSEVATTGLIDEIIRSGKRLILPMVDSRRKALNLYEVRDSAELVLGYMGIPEPGITEDRAVTLSEVDLIVIPGAGFDIKGNRIGYGGGYYDRLLSNGSGGLARADNQVMTVALAFEEQVADIPAEPHDVRVDIIITERRLIKCNP